MASADPWFEFELIRNNVKYNTVDRLKYMLLGINEECGVYLPKTGKKQEIIDRLMSTLDTWKQQNQTEKWAKAKAIIHQVRSYGQYTPARPTSTPTASSSVGVPAGSHAMHNSYNGGPAYSLAGGSSARYDTYGPPRKPTISHPSSSLSVPSKVTTGKSGINFKDSPFFDLDQQVSPVVECPESNSSTDRRQQTVVFTLTPDQINKLKSANSKYQLRLFCTSSAFYSPNPAFRTTSVPALIEFPPTCEVRVNNVQLSANLKGLKKKPGTAPPPDLGKYIRLNTTANKVELVYVNSQQPVQAKKFYLVVHLVKTTAVDFLVDQLIKSSYVSASDVRAKMKASIVEDDDIIAGPQKMSLKCPLSFMRVATPCRSSKCVHPQCFDATSWFSVMEQTTTWLCPVCEKSLEIKDLIIDGYFDGIVKSCPDSVEDVFVEADGEWHTQDNKHGSPHWTALHPPQKAILAPTLPRKPVSQTKSPPNGKLPNGKSRADDYLTILDSDDEEENQVKKELSPSFGASSSGSQAPSVPRSESEAVIDLTLDSDEEAPPLSLRKRKALDAPSPTEQIWKKSRPPIAESGGSGITARPAPPNVHDPSAMRYPPNMPFFPPAAPTYGNGHGYGETESAWARSTSGSSRWS